MINVALVLFAVAAVLGITLLVKRIKLQGLPMALVIPHGLFAASGLLLLLLSVVNEGVVFAKLPLVLFVFVALGGFTLLTLHLKGKFLPVPLVLVHGSLAVVAFLILLLRSMA